MLVSHFTGEVNYLPNALIL